MKKKGQKPNKTLTLSDSDRVQLRGIMYAIKHWGALATFGPSDRELCSMLEQRLAPTKKTKREWK